MKNKKIKKERIHKVGYSKMVMFLFAKKRDLRLKGMAVELKKIMEASGEDFVKNIAVKKIIDDMWQILYHLKDMPDGKNIFPSMRAGRSGYDGSFFGEGSGSGMDGNRLRR